jgi:hypothetical protein
MTKYINKDVVMNIVPVAQQNTRHQDACAERFG